VANEESVLHFRIASRSGDVGEAAADLMQDIEQSSSVTDVTLSREPGEPISSDLAEVAYLVVAVSKPPLLLETLRPWFARTRDATVSIRSGNSQIELEPGYNEDERGLVATFLSNLPGDPGGNPLPDD
jgi:hypothetical protein